MTTESALETLVRQGLVQRARELVGTMDLRSLSTEERMTRKRLLDLPGRVNQGIFFPLVDPVDATRDRRVQVLVALRSGGDLLPGPEVLDPATARRAVRDALDAAWQQCRGDGARPPVELRLPLLQEVPEERRRVEGRSLFLATFLAAVGCFGERLPKRNILATGAPGDTLDALARKQRCVPDDLPFKDLLTIGPTATEPGDQGLPVSRCEDLAHAIARTYGLTPVVGTKVPCLHAYCGDKRRDPPARFLRREKLGDGILPLDPVLTLENFQRNIDAVLQAIPPHEPVELSLATPVCFAAALGWHLANGARRVWIVDARSNESWWSTEERHAPSGRAPGVRRETARVIVTRYPERALAGWEAVPIAPELVVGDLREQISLAVNALSKVDRLALALDVPVAFAFALGVCLKGPCLVLEFLHRQGTHPDGYERMHTVRREGC